MPSNTQGQSTLSGLGGLSGSVLVGCRAGQNGQQSALGGTNFFNNFRSRHVMPYGADAVQLIYAGFSQLPVETPIPPTGVYSVRRMTISAGGSGYVAGDTVVGPTAGAVTPWQAIVQAVSSGAITKLAIIKPGLYYTIPADATAQSATSGAGSGATFGYEFDGWAGGGHVGMEPVYATQTFTGPNAVEVFSKGFYGDGSQNWDLTIPSGGLLITDPIPCDVPIGGAIALRGEWCGAGLYMGRLPMGGAYGGSYPDFANNISSLAEYANQTTISSTQAKYLIQPAAIIGIPKKPGPTMLIMGSSREYGFATNSVGSVSATYDPQDANGNLGWLEKALGVTMPYSNMSRGSDAFFHWTQSTSTVSSVAANNRWGRLQLIKALRPTAVYLNCAINDFLNGKTAAATQALEQQFVAEVRGCGVKYVFTDTTDPNTTSTDNWATTTNQTQTSASAGILARNAALRSSGASGYAGYDFFIDQGTITESAIGSGLWAVTGTASQTTGDGTHCGAYLHTAKAANAAPIIATNIRL
jgi:hypothetical protein